MTKYGQKILSHNAIQMYQLGTFANHKDLLGQCQVISENLRPIGQRQSSPYDQVPCGNIYQWKDLLGQC